MSAVDSLADKLGGTTLTPAAAPDDEKSLKVTRKHVLTLDQADGPVYVSAPGYEDLIAAEDWKDLAIRPDLLLGVENLKWEKPSKIQAQVLTYLKADGRPNIIAQSKNGSGKTGAFGLFMLSSIDPSVKATQAICLTTTRDLCLQTTERIQKMAAFMSPKPEVAAVLGGAVYKEKITAQVIVATPGRLLAMMKERKYLDVSKVKLLVYDEADDILTNFYAQANEIRNKGLPDKPDKGAALQVLLFSASFFYLDPKNPASKQGREFTDVTLDVKRRGPPLSIMVQDVEGLRNPNVTHFVAKLPESKSLEDSVKSKAEFLASVYELMTASKTIIFCNTHKAAHTVVASLKAKGHSPAVITGEKDVTTAARAKVLAEFEQGITKVLVTTLYEKGIDIPGLKLVINFDLPVEYSEKEKRFLDEPRKEGFQHRCGRVGRFGAIGACIHLVTGVGDAKVIQQLAMFFKLRMHKLPEDTLEAAAAVESAFTTPLECALDGAKPPAPAPAPVAGGAGGKAWGDMVA